MKSFTTEEIKMIEFGGTLMFDRADNMDDKKKIAEVFARVIEMVESDSSKQNARSEYNFSSPQHHDFIKD